jgi:hypothetical protein
MTSGRIPDGNRLHQISDDDLETCERAIAALELLVQKHGEFPECEHFIMLSAAIKRVRDDYGPHTHVRIIPADL